MANIRVVLADDHAAVRDSIRNFLEHAPGIEVIGQASNGIEALHLARKLTPDVLLLDMEMPGMTGIEVAKQLQTARSPVRILALSAYDDWQYIKGLFEVGAAGYLTKMEAPEIIIEAVRGVAQGERGWISGQVAKQMRAWTGSQTKKSAQIPLTTQEEEVLRLIVADKTDQEIGMRLGVSKKLVETYMETLFAKLGVDSRVRAATHAIQEELIERNSTSIK